MNTVKHVAWIGGMLILIPSLAFGGTPLSDVELDTVGASGESLSVSMPEEQMDAWSDLELETMAAGFSRTVWPFQHGQTRYFHHLRTVSVPASDGQGGTTPLHILNGRGFEPRPTTVPPLP